VTHRRIFIVSLIALAFLPCAAAGQATSVRGTVLAAESDAPLVGATVRALRSGRSSSTDRMGRFSLWVDHLPDTLVAAFIGRLPDSVALDSVPPGTIRIVLVQAPTYLTDITVTAASPSGSDEITSLGRWQLSMDAVRAVPPAIESDVFRAFSLVPAVSFSSPLSARPIIRGYDASESSFRIDGHEVLNLYHIGRAFSAFPADAAQQVSVSASPPPVSEGGTLAGIVEVTGQSGAVEGIDGGVDLSFVSASGWLGGGSAVRGFGAARAVHLSSISVVSSQTVPYDFQDFYASAVVAGKNGPQGRITAFASRDHLLDRDIGSGMDWNNLLLGTRWNVMSGRTTTLTALSSATRFGEDVSDIQARRSRLDLRNRFARFATGMELGVRTPSSRISFGTTVGARQVSNRITPLSGDDFAATDLEVRRVEVGGYAEWSRNLGSGVFQVGARVDAAGGAHVFQPRARVQFPLFKGLSLSLGAGRTGRLHHLVSDPQSEPDIAFYDFWLSAGENGVPIPKVDHASVDVDGANGSLVWRVSGYLSGATGLAELRPVTEPSVAGSSQFRYGRGRTAGLEIQLGIQSKSDRASSLSLTYVLSRSERNWGQGWVPWTQDRRHLLRGLGYLRLSGRWSWYSAFEATSAIPLTLVDQVIFLDNPPDTSLGFPGFLYGRENSARGSGTARADVGLKFGFRGFGRSRATLGISVINIGFGPVAPLKVSTPIPEPGGVGEPDNIRVRYERLFNLPAIPTLTLRMEF
jgi:hypothetical protein